MSWDIPARAAAYLNGIPFAMPSQISFTLAGEYFVGRPRPARGFVFAEFFGALCVAGFSLDELLFAALCL